jgi:hypothetical protein
MANIRGLQSVGNQEARDRALGMLPGAIGLGQGISESLSQEQARRASAVQGIQNTITQLESGIPFEETDFYSDDLFKSAEADVDFWLKEYEKGQISLEEYEQRVDDAYARWGEFMPQELIPQGIQLATQFLG